jgi:hypothetical protein
MVGKIAARWPTCIESGKCLLVFLRSQVKVRPHDEIKRRRRRNEEVWLADLAVLDAPENRDAWAKGTPEDWVTDLAGHRFGCHTRLQPVPPAVISRLTMSTRTVLCCANAIAI